MPKFNIHISVITYYVDVIKDQPFLIAALISQHSRNCVEFRSQDLCKPMQWNVPLNLRVTWARTRPEVYSCARVSTLPLSESVIPEMAKIWPFYGPNMLLTWSLKLFFSWIIVNVPRDAPCQKYKMSKCSMPNFTILGVSHRPLFLEVAKIWPFYGQKLFLAWSFKLVLPES